MDLIAKWEQIDDFNSAPDVLYHLNRWMDSQKFDAAWKPDPLLERMPKNLRQIFNSKIFSQKSFETSDLLYLRESFWMREISRWVSRQPASSQFNTWVEKLDPPLESDAATQLAVADRLFDWTVRNVQLDPLLPVVQEKTVGPTPPSLENQPATFPASARGAQVNRGPVTGMNCGICYSLDTVMLGSAPVSSWPWHGNKIWKPSCLGSRTRKAFGRHYRGSPRFC